MSSTERYVAWAEEGKLWDWQVARARRHDTDGRHPPSADWTGGELASDVAVVIAAGRRRTNQVPEGSRWHARVGVGSAVREGEEERSASTAGATPFCG